MRPSMRHQIRRTDTRFGGFVDAAFDRTARFPSYDQRLLVEGSNNDAGYLITEVPPGVQGVQVDYGRPVPGPWAALSGRGWGITADPAHNTNARIERETAAGLVIRAQAGDILSLEGRDYLIVLDARAYPHLVVVTPGMDLAAAVAKARKHTFGAYFG